MAVRCLSELNPPLMNIAYRTPVEDTPGRGISRNAALGLWLPQDAIINPCNTGVITDRLFIAFAFLKADQIYRRLIAKAFG
jgi:hypothetical protein